MAKDLDFRKTPSKKPTLKYSGSELKASALERRGQISQSKSLSWLALVVIMAVFAVGVGLYYQSLQPPKTSISKNSEKLTNEVATKEELVINVFDGGAGEDVLLATIKTLQESGFTVTNSGKTQFEYDKTYIWYKAGFESDAQKIASLLSSRKTVLKESKIKGGFTIQIQLGKE